MAKGFFITGTDTEIGKTTASLALMRTLKRQGYCVAGMKPVAAGCRTTPDGLRNSDAEQLRQEAGIDLTYDLVNPFAYEPPIAPHIAAEQTGNPIHIETIVDAYQAIATLADIVIVEGIGGWAVPINHRQTMADVAAALELPVILVAGVRLGCLNHTLLTYAAIKASNCHTGGWIANRLSEGMPMAEQNIRYLQQALPVAYLGELPYQHPVQQQFDIPLLNTGLLGL